MEGSGVPVGWNEGAVAFNVVPLVVMPSAWLFDRRSAAGAMLGASGFPWGSVGYSKDGARMPWYVLILIRAKWQREVLNVKDGSSQGSLCVVDP